MFEENLNISLLALFIANLKELNTGIICLITGPANASPVLLRAAFMLSNEPWNVWLALKAFSPNVSNIISENCSKLICPLDTMSRISSSVVPKALANVAAAFIPL